MQHRSVSQLKLYERCPKAYKLSRIDNVWQKPAAWLGQGSAVHEAAEAYERSGRNLNVIETQDVFRSSYEHHINAAAETTPNFDYWFASGPYGGELDIGRRFNIGLEQTTKYIDWYQDHPEEVIWIAPDGTPGIEIGFDIDLDGVQIKGFIDAVIFNENTKEIIVRDNKTGNKPGDDFQLAVYAVALAEQYGIEQPTVGDYWMGRNGKPTDRYDLTFWTREKVSEKFRWLEDNLQAGNFDATPDPSICRFCDVAWACDEAL